MRQNQYDRSDEKDMDVAGEGDSRSDAHDPDEGKDDTERGEHGD
jgi:hypothetical protein